MKATEKIHHGKNVKRFREMLGLKQEWLAFELGDDWSQKKVSQLENKEEIDDATLEEVSKLLKVPTDVLKNFNEEATFQVLANTFDNSGNTGSINNINSNCTLTFNPLEKLMEAFETSKALTEENKTLYERLLQSEKEKVELLQSVVQELKEIKVKK
ncbi:helix-turn-helix domain-containing protein [Chitinophagaceae bacterium MMS25-I14]